MSNATCAAIRLVNSFLTAASVLLGDWPGTLASLEHLTGLADRSDRFTAVQV
jgi:hypothetical protein